MDVNILVACYMGYRYIVKEELFGLTNDALQNDVKGPIELINKAKKSKANPIQGIIILQRHH